MNYSDYCKLYSSEERDRRRKQEQEDYVFPDEDEGD